jgi:hypothetical protein
MTVIALCNVGLRDVTYQGQAIRPARAEGEKLLAAWDDEESNPVAAELAFPIIEPSLRYIVRQQQMKSTRRKGKALQKKDQPIIHRLILYGTDQDMAQPQHRANDTLYFAELAARRLPQVMGPQRLGQAEAVRLQGINPSLYDETFERFGALLAAWKDDPALICYVILGGGVPAANTALLLQGVRYFGDRLRVVYTPMGGASQELRVGMQVARAFDEAAAVEHLQRLDFANARPLLNSLSIGAGGLHLADYAAARLNFNFAMAQSRLHAALRDSEHVTRRFIHEQMSLLDLDALLAKEEETLTQDRLLALLRELYWNAQITYDHGRYADFLGRIYRFQEAVLRYLVESIFHLPTDLAPAVRVQTLTAWRAGIEANPHLLAFLNQAQHEGQPLNWLVLNRPTYRVLLRYALAEGAHDPPLGLDAAGVPLIPPKDRKRFKALMDRINGLDRLIDLRHRTIIGHGFKGVSEEMLRDNFSPDKRGEEPPDRLKTILNMLKVDMRANPYRTVADYIIRSVKS